MINTILDPGPIPKDLPWEIAWKEYGLNLQHQYGDTAYICYFIIPMAIFYSEYIDFMKAELKVREALALVFNGRKK